MYIDTDIGMGIDIDIYIDRYIYTAHDKRHQQTTAGKVMLMGLFLNVYITKRFFPGLDEGTFHYVYFTVLCTESARSRA